MGQDRSTLSPREAARIAKVGKSTIMRAIEAAQLEARRDNRNQWRIERSALDRWTTDRPGSDRDSPMDRTEPDRDSPIGRIGADWSTHPPEPVAGLAGQLLGHPPDLKGALPDLVPDPHRRDLDPALLELPGPERQLRQRLLVGWGVRCGRRPCRPGSPSGRSGAHLAARARRCPRLREVSGALL